MCQIGEMRKGTNKWTNEWMSGTNGAERKRTNEMNERKVSTCSTRACVPPHINESPAPRSIFCMEMFVTDKTNKFLIDGKLQCLTLSSTEFASRKTLTRERYSQFLSLFTNLTLLSFLSCSSLISLTTMSHYYYCGTKQLFRKGLLIVSYRVVSCAVAPGIHFLQKLLEEWNLPFFQVRKTREWKNENGIRNGNTGGGAERWLHYATEA